MAKYDQTTVNIPNETKKKIRLIAAELGIPMGKAALQLIEIGLGEYTKGLDKQSGLSNKRDSIPVPGPAA
jgi:hypothetical protein